MFDALRKRLFGSHSMARGAAPAPAQAASEAARLLALGNELLDQGLAGPAAESYRRATELDPQASVAYVNLGYALSEQGLHAQAEEPLQRALTLDPGSADAHYMLGMGYMARGMPDRAVEHLRRALELKADFVACRLSLCRLLADTGRGAEALAVIDAGIAAGPADANLFFYLGNLKFTEGAFAEAAHAYDRALAIEPSHFQAMVQGAKAMHRVGRFDGAEAQLEAALALKPDDVYARCSLAEVLVEQRRIEAAVEQYRKVIVMAPGHASAYCDLGSVLRTQGRLDEAIEMYRRAVMLQPAFAAALSNLGVALQERGHLSEAVDAMRQALRIEPRQPAALNNLGNAYHELDRLEEAVESYESALRIDPDYAEAHGNLGGVRQEQGHLDEALRHYARAIALKSDYLDAHHNLLFTANYHPDLTAEEIYAYYREYDRQHGRPQLQSVAHSNDRNPSRRLRIGYVSPDFRSHSIRHFLEPLLAHHDHAHVEVFAYAELLQPDAVTERLRRNVDHWVPTIGLSDDELADRIREDRIDVLIDLAGHTARNRLGVFARKPAPVSATWLGYGYTTGLSAIDYMITDEQGAPPGSEHLYSERPWRLATPGYAFRPGEGMGTVSASPAMLRGTVTFATLTRAVRINHRTIRVWARVLARVPGSKLIVNSKSFQDAAMRSRLTKSFAEHGIGAERLQLGFDSPPWDVLRQVDIGLDCFPHNSGTTLFETLYMGIPFVTLADRPSVGRLGSSILHGIGHPEWIAQTEEEYVEIAVRLASDLPSLAALRGRLRAEMEASPLRDEVGLARKAEAAYRQMFEQWATTPPALP